MTYRLSPSKMNLFFECERCFWLEMNEDVSRPSGPFPSLPGGMDRILKQHFQKYREENQSPPEIKEAHLDLEPVQDEELLEKARNWRTKPKWDDPETEAVLCGEVDDLLRNEEEDIVVLDYKTRGYPPKEETGVPDYYARQVNLYNLILRSNQIHTAEYGLILYYHPDRVQENGDVVFHNDLRKVPVDIQKGKKQVQNAVETLQKEIPEPNPDCDFCQYSQH